MHAIRDLHNRGSCKLLTIQYSHLGCCQKSSFFLIFFLHLHYTIKMLDLKEKYNCHAYQVI